MRKVFCRHTSDQTISEAKRSAQDCWVRRNTRQINGRTMSTAAAIRPALDRMALSRCPRPRQGFLTIPVEMWLDIYVHLWEDSNGAVPVDIQTSGPDPAILSTCRQLYEEAKTPFDLTRRRHNARSQYMYSAAGGLFFIPSDDSDESEGDE